MIIRTAIHDTQVYPYESLKWAKKLRAAGWDSVYVGIDGNGGHFAAADAMIQQRAEDAALLAAALEPIESNASVYNCSPSKSRKTRRKRSTNRSGREGISGKRSSSRRR
jgi:hypothetical protein